MNAPEAFLRSHVAYTGDDCVIWPYGGSNGYGAAVVDGLQKMAHRWMCILAHGEPPSPAHEAAHSCGNRPCINPRHLRWATRLENEADKERHGSVARGESHGQTNLTDNDVRAIRADERTQRAIASDYGISAPAVSLIRSRQRWSHIL